MLTHYISPLSIPNSSCTLNLWRQLTYMSLLHAHNNKSQIQRLKFFINKLTTSELHVIKKAESFAQRFVFAFINRVTNYWRIHTRHSNTADCHPHRMDYTVISALVKSGQPIRSVSPLSRKDTKGGEGGGATRIHKLGTTQIRDARQALLSITSYLTPPG